MVISVLMVLWLLIGEHSLSLSNYDGYGWYGYRWLLYTALGTTPNRRVQKRNFTVTHPFHPLYKRKFILIDHRNNWGENRVFFYDATGELKSLPAQWTSVIPPDPFIILSKGVSYFNIKNLIEIVNLIEGVKASKHTKNKKDNK